MSTSLPMTRTKPQFTIQAWPRVHGVKGALLLQLSSKKFKITERGAEELAPTTGSHPLSRWAQGPLLVPYRSGTPTYKLQVKTRSGTCTHMPPHVP
jgi:hypothetical protein